MHQDRLRAYHKEGHLLNCLLALLKFASNFVCYETYFYPFMHETIQCAESTGKKKSQRQICVSIPEILYYRVVLFLL
jgi:hypothetical protein